MTDNYLCSDLWIIWRRDRKKARYIYERDVGVGVDDMSLDKQLEALLDKCVDDDSPTIAIPKSLAIGLAMRHSAKESGRKRPPLEVWVKRMRVAALRYANLLWATLVKNGVSSQKAKHQAAVAARKEFAGARLELGTLMRDMRLKDGQRDLLKNNT